ncbi:MAG: glycosyltransferase [Chloroflexi bacterium]|nr:glycosyltransferase [Chloroflexota bacterium]
MRVGLVMPGFSAGPDDWCIPALRSFAACLARTDEVRLLTLRYPYRPSRYAVEGVEVTALGGGLARGQASLRLWRQALDVLAAEHRGRPFDVLHAFWATESGAVTALAGRWLGIPTLVSLAGGELVSMPSVGYGDALHPAERVKVNLALRLASGITVGSRYMLSLVPRSVRPRAARLPLGVDARRFIPGDMQRPAAVTTVVHVASLVPVKDQHTLLRAVAAASQPVRLEVAGDGPLAAHLAHLAEELGVRDRVCFRGPVAHDCLPAVYRRAAAFALSSVHEAQAMAPLEAAACGVPIVGTAVGVLPELCPDAALTVERGDWHALARALTGLLGDPERRASMGAAARRRVEADFTVEQCVDRFRACYEHLR